MQTEQAEFERVTAGLTTKSDKIRALSRHGASTAQIARFLDIRYQHARNVLVQAGLHQTQDDAEGDGAAPRDFAWVEMDAGGRVTLPVDLLARAGLAAGPVHVRLGDGGLEILSRKAALRRAQALLAEYVPPGRSVVDEFIADRREEAGRE